MSAPHEVFLAPTIVGGWESPVSVCQSTITYNDVTPVRYLLASLTCGECAVEHPSQCAMPESAFDVLDYKRDNRPACMVIKPKVQP